MPTPGWVVATALVSDAPCAVASDGDGIRVALPEIGRFEVIVIGEAPAVNQ